jgi:hypothetical protein
MKLVAASRQPPVTPIYFVYEGNILARKKFKQVFRIRIEMAMTFRPGFVPTYCSFGMFKI